MSVLKQDHFAYDSFTVLDTVIQGNMKLYEIMKEKDAIYAKDEMTDEDGMRASELEGEFAELNGWEADPTRQSSFRGWVSPTPFCTTVCPHSARAKRSMCFLRRLCSETPT